MFHDRLTNDTADQYDSGQLQTVLKPALARAACADDFMRHTLLDKGVTLRYEYQTLAGAKLVSIEIAEMSRRLLKFSGGSVDDYATCSASFPTRPSC